VVDPCPPLQTRRQSRVPQRRGPQGTQVPHIFAEIAVSTKYKRLKKVGGKASHKKEKERESRGGFHGLLARVGSCRSWDVKRVLRENEEAGISKG